MSLPEVEITRWDELYKVPKLMLTGLEIFFWESIWEMFDEFKVKNKLLNEVRRQTWFLIEIVSNKYEASEN